jgi:hypothetical protein
MIKLKIYAEFAIMHVRNVQDLQIINVLNAKIHIFIFHYHYHVKQLAL